MTIVEVDNWRFVLQVEESFSTTIHDPQHFYVRVLSLTMDLSIKTA